MTSYIDVSVEVVGKSTITRPARGEGEVSSLRLFLFIVGVSKGSIDPLRRLLSVFSKKERQRIVEKKEIEKALGREAGEEEEEKKEEEERTEKTERKNERSAMASQRKMDFREVRTGLNSRKMSKQVEE